MFSRFGSKKSSRNKSSKSSSSRKSDGGSGRHRHSSESQLGRTSSKRSLKDDEPGEADSSRRRSSRRRTDSYPDERAPERAFQDSTIHETKRSTPSRSHRYEESRGGSSRAVDDEASTLRPTATRDPQYSPNSIPNQFPGQVPNSHAQPYQPNPAGAAADYYGDNGESVAFQPGVRPKTPILIGAEPHLQQPTEISAPPSETGEGAANEFYSGADFGAGAGSRIPHTASPPQMASNERPIGPPSHRPSYGQSSYADTMYTAPNGSAPQSAGKIGRPTSTLPMSVAQAAGVAGAAGVAAAAWNHHEHKANGRQSSSGRVSGSYSTPTKEPLGPPGSWPSAQMSGRVTGEQREEEYESGSSSGSNSDIGARGVEERGTFGRFVDWWKDHEDVRKMEAYTEYIGVCKDCFDPATSIWDAPRRHRPRRRSSRGSLRARTRVGKESRYSIYENDSRRRSREALASAAAAGLAGVGLAEASKERKRRRRSEQANFSDYDIRTGLYDAGAGVQSAGQRASDEVETRIQKGVVHRDSRGNIRISRHHPSHGTAVMEHSGHQRHDEKQSHTGRNTALTAAAGAAAAGTVIAAMHRKDSHRQSKDGRSRISRGASQSAMVEASSSSSEEEQGFFSKIFSPSPKKKKTTKQSRPGRPSSRSSSSSGSSHHSQLLYGFGDSRTSLPRPKTPTRRQRKKSSADLGAGALMGMGGLGEAAAILAAEDAKRPPHKRHYPDLFQAPPYGSRPSMAAAPPPHVQKSYRTTSDDAWEDFSDDEISSISAGSDDEHLAFGGSSVSHLQAAHKSSESLSSASSGSSRSSKASGKWDWRWRNGARHKERRGSGAHKLEQAAVAAGVAGAAAAATSNLVGSRRGSRPQPVQDDRRQGSVPVPVPPQSQPLSQPPPNMSGQLQELPPRPVSEVSTPSKKPRRPSEPQIEARIGGNVPLAQPTPVSPKPSLPDISATLPHPGIERTGSLPVVGSSFQNGYKSLPQTPKQRQTEPTPSQLPQVAQDAFNDRDKQKESTADSSSKRKTNSKWNSILGVTAGAALVGAAAHGIGDKQKHESRSRDAPIETGDKFSPEGWQTSGGVSVRKSKPKVYKPDIESPQRPQPEPNAQSSRPKASDDQSQSSKMRKSESGDPQASRTSYVRDPAPTGSSDYVMSGANQTEQPSQTTRERGGRRSNRDPHDSEPETPRPKAYSAVSDSPESQHDWHMSAYADAMNKGNAPKYETSQPVKTVDKEQKPDVSQHVPGSFDDMPTPQPTDDSTERPSEHHYETRHEVSERREVEPLFDDDIFDPQFFKKKIKKSDETGALERESSQVLQDLDQRYTADAKRSQADFFRPDELSSPSKATDQRVDEFADMYYPAEGSGRARSFSFGNADGQPIPRLNIIAPTPPRSEAGSARARSVSPSPSRDGPDESAIAEEPEVEPPVGKPSSRSVTWAEPQTRTYNVESPESTRDDYFADHPSDKLPSREHSAAPSTAPVVVENMSRKQEADRRESSSANAPLNEPLDRVSTQEIASRTPLPGSDVSQATNGDSVSSGRRRKSSLKSTPPTSRAQDPRDLEPSLESSEAPDSKVDIEKPTASQTEEKRRSSTAGSATREPRDKGSEDSAGKYAAGGAAVLAGSIVGSQLARNRSYMQDSQNASSKQPTPTRSHSMPGGFDSEDDDTTAYEDAVTSRGPERTQSDTNKSEVSRAPTSWISRHGTGRDEDAEQESVISRARTEPQGRSARDPAEPSTTRRSATAEDIESPTLRSDPGFPLRRSQTEPLGDNGAGTNGERKGKKKKKRPSYVDYEAENVDPDQDQDQGRTDRRLDGEQISAPPGVDELADLEEEIQYDGAVGSTKVGESVQNGEYDDYKSVTRTSSRQSKSKDSPESKSSSGRRRSTPANSETKEKKQGGLFGLLKRATTDGASRRTDEADRIKKDEEAFEKARRKKRRSTASDISDATFATAMGSEVSTTSKGSRRSGNYDDEARSSRRSEEIDSGTSSQGHKDKVRDTGNEHTTTQDFIRLNEDEPLISQDTMAAVQGAFRRSSTAVSRDDRSPHTVFSAPSAPLDSNVQDRRRWSALPSDPNDTRRAARPVPDHSRSKSVTFAKSSYGPPELYEVVPEMVRLPESPPGSTYSDEEQDVGPKPQTPQRPQATPLPARTISTTAVPLRFRRTPVSPSVRESPVATTSAAPPVDEPVVTPSPSRTKSGRPSSTEFKSGEFRPLYLVERNRKVPEPEDQLPSLPSSRTSSVLGTEREDEFESALESPETLHSPQSFASAAARHREFEMPDYLDSQQTTPKAGSFPSSVFETPTSRTGQHSSQQESPTYFHDFEGQGADLDRVTSQLERETGNNTLPSTSNVLEEKSHYVDTDGDDGQSAESESLQRSRSSKTHEPSSILLPSAIAAGTGVTTGAILEKMSSHESDEDSDVETPSRELAHPSEASLADHIKQVRIREPQDEKEPMTLDLDEDDVRSPSPDSGANKTQEEEAVDESRLLPSSSARHAYVRSASEATEVLDSEEIRPLSHSENDLQKGGNQSSTTHGIDLATSDGEEEPEQGSDNDIEQSNELEIRPQVESPVRQLSPSPELPSNILEQINQGFGEGSGKRRRSSLQESLSRIDTFEVAKDTPLPALEETPTLQSPIREHQYDIDLGEQPESPDVPTEDGRDTTSRTPIDVEGGVSHVLPHLYRSQSFSESEDDRVYDSAQENAADEDEDEADVRTPIGTEGHVGHVFPHLQHPGDVVLQSSSTSSARVVDTDLRGDDSSSVSEESTNEDVHAALTPTSDVKAPSGFQHMEDVGSENQHSQDEIAKTDQPRYEPPEPEVAQLRGTVSDNVPLRTPIETEGDVGHVFPHLQQASDAPASPPPSDEAQDSDVTTEREIPKSRDEEMSDGYEPLEKSEESEEEDDTVQPSIHEYLGAGAQQSQVKESPSFDNQTAGESSSLPQDIRSPVDTAGGTSHVFPHLQETQNKAESVSGAQAPLYEQQSAEASEAESEEKDAIQSEQETVNRPNNEQSLRQDQNRVADTDAGHRFILADSDSDEEAADYNPPTYSGRYRARRRSTADGKEPKSPSRIGVEGDGEPQQEDREMQDVQSSDSKEPSSFAQELVKDNFTKSASIAAAVLGGAAAVGYVSSRDRRSTDEHPKESSDFAKQLVSSHFGESDTHAENFVSSSPLEEDKSLNELSETGDKEHEQDSRLSETPVEEQLESMDESPESPESEDESRESGTKHLVPADHSENEHEEMADESGDSAERRAQPAEEPIEATEEPTATVEESTEPAEEPAQQWKEDDDRSMLENSSDEQESLRAPKANTESSDFARALLAEHFKDSDKHAELYNQNRMQSDSQELAEPLDNRDQPLIAKESSDFAKQLVAEHFQGSNKHSDDYHQATSRRDSQESDNEPALEQKSSPVPTKESSDFARSLVAAHFQDSHQHAQDHLARSQQEKSEYPPSIQRDRSTTSEKHSSDFARELVNNHFNDSDRHLDEYHSKRPQTTTPKEDTEPEVRSDRSTKESSEFAKKLLAEHFIDSDKHAEDYQNTAQDQDFNDDVSEATESPPDKGPSDFAKELVSTHFGDSDKHADDYQKEQEQLESPDDKHADEYQSEQEQLGSSEGHNTVPSSHQPKESSDFAKSLVSDHFEGSDKHAQDYHNRLDEQTSSPKENADTSSLQDKESSEFARSLVAGHFDGSDKHLEDYNSSPSQQARQVVKDTEGVTAPNKESTDFAKQLMSDHFLESDKHADEYHSRASPRDISDDEKMQNSSLQENQEVSDVDSDTPSDVVPHEEDSGMQMTKNTLEEEEGTIRDRSPETVSSSPTDHKESSEFAKNLIAKHFDESDQILVYVPNAEGREAQHAGLRRSPKSKDRDQVVEDTSHRRRSSVAGQVTDDHIEYPSLEDIEEDAAVEDDEALDDASMNDDRQLDNEREEEPSHYDTSHEFGAEANAAAIDVDKESTALAKDLVGEHFEQSDELAAQFMQGQEDEQDTKLSLYGTMTSNDGSKEPTDFAKDIVDRHFEESDSLAAQEAVRLSQHVSSDDTSPSQNVPVVGSSGLARSLLKSRFEASLADEEDDPEVRDAQISENEDIHDRKGVLESNIGSLQLHTSRHLAPDSIPGRDLSPIKEESLSTENLADEMHAETPTIKESTDFAKQLVANHFDGSDRVLAQYQPALPGEDGEEAGEEEQDPEMSARRKSVSFVEEPETIPAVSEVQESGNADEPAGELDDEDDPQPKSKKKKTKKGKKGRKASTDGNVPTLEPTISQRSEDETVQGGDPEDDTTMKSPEQESEYPDDIPQDEEATWDEAPTKKNKKGKKGKKGKKAAATAAVAAAAAITGASISSDLDESETPQLDLEDGDDSIAETSPSKTADVPEPAAASEREERDGKLSEVDTGGDPALTSKDSRTEQQPDTAAVPEKQEPSLSSMVDVEVAQPTEKAQSTMENTEDLSQNEPELVDETSKGEPSLDEAFMTNEVEYITGDDSMQADEMMNEPGDEVNIDQSPSARPSPEDGESMQPDESLEIASKDSVEEEAVQPTEFVAQTPEPEGDHDEGATSTSKSKKKKKDKKKKNQRAASDVQEDNTTAVELDSGQATPSNIPKEIEEEREMTNSTPFTEHEDATTSIADEPAAVTPEELPAVATEDASATISQDTSADPSRFQEELSPPTADVAADEQVEASSQKIKKGKKNKKNKRKGSEDFLDEAEATEESLVPAENTEAQADDLEPVFNDRELSSTTVEPFTLEEPLVAEEEPWQEPVSQGKRGKKGKKNKRKDSTSSAKEAEATALNEPDASPKEEGAVLDQDESSYTGGRTFGDKPSDIERDAQQEQLRDDVDKTQLNEYLDDSNEMDTRNAIEPSLAVAPEEDEWATSASNKRKKAKKKSKSVSFDEPELTSMHDQDSQYRNVAEDTSADVRVSAEPESYRDEPLSDPQPKSTEAAESAIEEDSRAPSTSKKRKKEKKEAKKKSVSFDDDVKPPVEASLRPPQEDSSENWGLAGATTAAAAGAAYTAAEDEWDPAPASGKKNKKNKKKQRSSQSVRFDTSGRDIEQSMETSDARMDDEEDAKQALKPVDVPMEDATGHQEQVKEATSDNRGVTDSTESAAENLTSRGSLQDKHASSEFARSLIEKHFSESDQIVAAHTSRPAMAPRFASVEQITEEEIFATEMPDEEKKYMEELDYEEMGEADQIPHETSDELDSGHHIEGTPDILIDEEDELRPQEEGDREETFTQDLANLDDERVASPKPSSQARSEREEDGSFEQYDRETTEEQRAPDEPMLETPVASEPIIEDAPMQGHTTEEPSIDEPVFEESPMKESSVDAASKEPNTAGDLVSEDTIQRQPSMEELNLETPSIQEFESTGATDGARQLGEEVVNEPAISEPKVEEPSSIDSLDELGVTQKRSEEQDRQEPVTLETTGKESIPEDFVPPKPEVGDVMVGEPNVHDPMDEDDENSREAHDMIDEKFESGTIDEEVPIERLEAVESEIRGFTVDEPMSEDQTGEDLKVKAPAPEESVARPSTDGVEDQDELAPIRAGAHDDQFRQQEPEEQSFENLEDDPMETTLAREQSIEELDLEQPAEGVSEDLSLTTEQNARSHEKLELDEKQEVSPTEILKGSRDLSAEQPSRIQESQTKEPSSFAKELLRKHFEESDNHAADYEAFANQKRVQDNTNQDIPREEADNTRQEYSSASDSKAESTSEIMQPENVPKESSDFAKQLVSQHFGDSDRHATEHAASQQREPEEQNTTDIEREDDQGLSKDQYANVMAAVSGSAAAAISLGVIQSNDKDAPMEAEDQEEEVTFASSKSKKKGKKNKGSKRKGSNVFRETDSVPEASAEQQKVDITRDESAPLPRSSTPDQIDMMDIEERQISASHSPRSRPVQELADDPLDEPQTTPIEEQDVPWATTAKSKKKKKKGKKNTFEAEPEPEPERQAEFELEPISTPAFEKMEADMEEGLVEPRDQDSPPEPTEMERTSSKLEQLAESPSVGVEPETTREAHHATVELHQDQPAEISTDLTTVEAPQPPQEFQENDWASSSGKKKKGKKGKGKVSELMARFEQPSMQGDPVEDVQPRPEPVSAQGAFDPETTSEPVQVDDATMTPPLREERAKSFDMETAKGKKGKKGKKGRKSLPLFDEPEIEEAKPAPMAPESFDNEAVPPDETPMFDEPAAIEESRSEEPREEVALPISEDTPSGHGEIVMGEDITAQPSLPTSREPHMTEPDEPSQLVVEDNVPDTVAPISEDLDKDMLSRDEDSPAIRTPFLDQEPIAVTEESDIQSDRGVAEDTVSTSQFDGGEITSEGQDPTDFETTPKDSESTPMLEGVERQRRGESSLRELHPSPHYEGTGSQVQETAQNESFIIEEEPEAIVAEQEPVFKEQESAIRKQEPMFEGSESEEPAIEKPMPALRESEPILEEVKSRFEEPAPALEEPNLVLETSESPLEDSRSAYIAPEPVTEELKPSAREPSPTPEASEPVLKELESQPLQRSQTLEQPKGKKGKKGKKKGRKSLPLDFAEESEIPSEAVEPPAGSSQGDSKDTSGTASRDEAITEPVVAERAQPEPEPETTNVERSVAEQSKGPITEPEVETEKAEELLEAERTAAPTFDKPTDNDDFDAAVAAGLRDSGFDPGLAAHDPKFQKRNTPPSPSSLSDEEENITARPSSKRQRQRRSKNLQTLDQPIHSEAYDREAAETDSAFDDIVTAGLAQAGFDSVLSQRRSNEATRGSGTNVERDPRDIEEARSDREIESEVGARAHSPTGPAALWQTGSRSSEEDLGSRRRSSRRSSRGLDKTPPARDSQERLSSPSREAAVEINPTAKAPSIEMQSSQTAREPPVKESSDFARQLVIKHFEESSNLHADYLAGQQKPTAPQPRTPKREKRRKASDVSAERSVSVDEEDADAPTPVEPSSKVRTSYLFTTPPSVGSASTQHGRSRSTSTAAQRETPHSIPEEAAEDEEAVGHTATRQRSSEDVEMAQHSPHDSRSRSALEPIAEDNQQMLQVSKRRRPASDFETPEHGTKSLRRSRDHPSQDLDLEALRALEAGSPVPARSTASSAVSEANIKRPYARSSQGSATMEEMRPASAASMRSRTPSAVSNRSVTPTLRRSGRSVSGDLRAASKRDEAEAPASPAEAKLGDESENIKRSISHEPLRGSGKERRREMSNDGVYEGWGDAQNSPMSPTRPPSLRKRQSTQILELENRLEQVTQEQQSLQEAKAQAQEEIQTANRKNQSLSEAVRARDLRLQEKDVEIGRIKASLDTLQQEASRLSEHNEKLQGANRNLTEDTNGRYATLQAEHQDTHKKWQESERELAELQGRHDELQETHRSLNSTVEDSVRQEISVALADKDQEIARLRGELDKATQQIRSLQQQLARTAQGQDFLNVRDEDYFESACQQLCQHVQQWVLRFSKFSDNKASRISSQIRDEEIETRLDNAILDGTEVDDYLRDRVQRRDIFMSIVMAMIWEYVFTRYLFGMDRDQRQKLKSLEKTLVEVGPQRAVAQWRATTLTLLSRRDAFQEQRADDTEAVVQKVYNTLSRLLNPPGHLVGQIQDSLRNVMRLAVDLSIEMRTQRAEYIMLPPLKPEYDTNGDLSRKVFFKASIMNERSGDFKSNDDLESRNAVVRLVLFPLVVKKGDDQGESDEEVIVCPAQVLVSRPPKEKKVVRVKSGALSMHDNKSTHSIAASTMDVDNPEEMV